MRDLTPSPAAAGLPKSVDAFGKRLLKGLLGLFQTSDPLPVQRKTDPSPPRRTPVPSRAQGTREMPQFPGVDFIWCGVDLNGEAPDNDAAIRASLIWFKHRFPGQAAEIIGPEEFRRKAWRIAEEVSLPLKGPRPGSGQLART